MPSGFKTQPDIRSKACLYYAKTSKKICYLSYPDSFQKPHDSESVFFSSIGHALGVREGQ